MSTFSSANIMDGNLVLKERTNRIKIKYSMHQYSIRLHNLGNWLIAAGLWTVCVCVSVCVGRWYSVCVCGLCVCVWSVCVGRWYSVEWI